MRPGILARVLHIKPSPLRKGPNGPFIFIHITKTAGTSIGNAIGLPVKHHLTAKEVIAKIGKNKWNEAYKFTFVRNPWDRIVSLYEYRRRKDKTKIASNNIPFTEWINLTLGPNTDPYYCNNVKSFQPQVDWLKDDEDTIAIDFIGKFESIREDFEQIRQAIGTRAELPHLNATKRSNYRDYYTDETRQIVANWYHEDIKTFDYTFD
jgi:hypothetical protein